MNSNIRLSQVEKEIIVSIITGLDPNAIIYLYGSRTHLLKKGGDIDLLIISEILDFSSKVDLLILLKEKLGEQKIDLTIKTVETFDSDPFFSSEHVQNELIQLH